jgi:GNAT superfamily N-acetyltransferase
MVAFAGADPIGVLIGAKRTSGTLIRRIAVRPDHRRQGHGRHLLASLGSKLAILGPPRIVTEVPETLGPCCELFEASEYTCEAVLTDYVARSEDIVTCDAVGGLLIPVTVDDLAANGLLEHGPPTCWERSAETLAARKGEIEGFAIASDERIEAAVLYTKDGEILALRRFVEDDGWRTGQLISHLRKQGMGILRFSKVHPAEAPGAQLEALGFRASQEHRLYAATARPC